MTAEPDRLSMALPVKGRLREGALRLLQDAGFEPEEPTERALGLRCHSAPLDVLLVRASDIPEYVQDGGVDCGITGMDLVRESGAQVTEALQLGFGVCTLEAAVAEEDSATDPSELNGRRVATAFPRLAAAVLAERGISVDLREVSGSVEIAPRLNVADAIVDLVSSGNTLRANGLRSLGVLFSSEAVLITSETSSPRVGDVAAALCSVVRARATRYVMFNAPTDAVGPICDVLPTDGSPSVVPLLKGDAVAIHALVPAASVWDLLPRLQSLGASSILVNPVGRMFR